MFYKHMSSCSMVFNLRVSSFWPVCVFVPVSFCQWQKKTLTLAITS